MTSLLELHGVSKRFGGVHALSEVSLTVALGEVVALMGGNGAGKSTLVSIISGLTRPDDGEMRFEGRPVSFVSAQEARRAGIETVFQTLALCDNLDAASNLFLGREPTVGFFPFKMVRRKQMERAASETIAALGVTIPDPRGAVGEYSGGQRQALAFARAVRNTSRLLILDEPTAALGVGERRAVLETVRRLRSERGMALLLITHNLEEMRALADRVVVLRHGRCVGSYRLSDVDDDAVVGLITGARS